MTWPNTTVSTTNLDAGTDEPRLARADLKDAVDKLNNIITGGINGEYVVVKFTGILARPDTHIPGNFTWRPQMTMAYSAGNAFVQFRSNVRSNVSVTSGYYFTLPEGRYEFTIIPTGKTLFANGAAWTANVNPYPLVPNPSTYFIGNTEVGVDSIQQHATDHFDIYREEGGGTIRISDVPSHLIVNSAVVSAQVSGGGWTGNPLGILENTPPTGRPSYQYFRIRKITD